MKEIKQEIVFQVFENVSELPQDVINLVKKAREARTTAYAPYSNFAVGAAILIENGEVVTGSNQENASYPSGLCAERTAIYYAGAKYSGSKILKMVIVAGSLKGETSQPIPPCGACRQSIAEYEVNQNSPIEIYFMGTSGKVLKSNSLKNLLPLIFDKSQL
ncbi:cytidine deaminase [Hyunsoonleella pacifica]|uniref:Cytidine deaminase n=1 Tax=Hyunsoonleella pacifica TaxID=1080224 RepID=A0A4Q9FKM2_9FLAO|nr:cytidine deaminase [Hyunsoonleella pacifica]TBN12479.1 cytidine deaminase [Hyunsoonleella pacifica]GGD29158.1 cytidine deaminase [Hyunsoonleella pacifica]